MDIQMEPRAILVLVGTSVEKHHFTFIPSLVGLAYGGEVKGCGAIRAVR